MKILLSILLLAYTSHITSASIETLYEWQYIRYAWKSFNQMNEYITKGKYDYQKLIPVDIDRTSGGRIFVTIARDKGVPASVHTLTFSNGGSQPLLKPFPNWEMYEDFNCDSILNVHRIAIDECDRLWILDTGKLANRFICPAKLLVYDVRRRDNLLFTLKIPERLSGKRSLLVAPIVKTSGLECDNTEVYLADAEGHGLITYSFTIDQFYRYNHSNFKPQPGAEHFVVSGENFVLKQGVTAMAKSPKRYPSDAIILSYASLSSRIIYSVDTRLLDKTPVSDPVQFTPEYIIPSQTSALAYSAGGTLFYGMTSENAIGCFNPFTSSNAHGYMTIINDPVRLQFISSMKFIKNVYPVMEEYLLVLSNRFQKVVTGSMNFDEVNFRILKISVKDLIDGTICEEL